MRIFITLLVCLLGLASVWLVFVALVEDEREHEKEDWCDGNSRSRREKE